MIDIRLAPHALSKHARLSPRHREAMIFMENVLRPLFGLRRLQIFGLLRRGRIVQIEDNAWTDDLTKYFVKVESQLEAASIELTMDPGPVDPSHLTVYEHARLDEIQKHVAPPFSMDVTNG